MIIMRVRTRKLPGNWTRLSTKDYMADVQHFDNPSSYGIDNGRISRLFIIRRSDEKKHGWGKTLVSYERGWDKKLSIGATDELKKFYEWIIKRYN